MVMIDKRTLEFILTDQQEEMEARAEETLCHRPEEDKIDLMRNNVEQCIQVSYDISADRTRKREINGLLLEAKQTKCDNLLLLTDHESKEIQQDGYKIKVKPVYEWSLE